MLFNKKKVFYWAPCLNKVGTVISTKNSAIGLAYYKRDFYDVYLINVCGEWDDYLEEIKKYDIKIISLSFSYYKFLPKTGFFSSRFSYILIFLISLFPLIKCLNRYKPDFFIMHLITSLPLFIMRFLNLETKFILRISGLPKLNFLRKFFWKKSSKKLFKITCPTNELLRKIEKQNIFELNKIKFLQDAIINLDKFKNKKNNSVLKINSEKKLILSVGRLTKQKNYKYLVNEFKNFLKYSDDYNLMILGDGEEKNELNKLIKNLNLQDRVHLIGRVENVYEYMKQADVFVLSSLWEELGFVIVEAAFNNLFVISSDCPNGPKEFIDKNKCGILFQSNSFNSLTEAMIKFLKIENTFNVKLNAKKKSSLYTKFNHHLELTKILQNEN